MIITAEAIAVSAVLFQASAILAAYLTDWIGLTISPPAILVVSLAGSAAALVAVWRRSIHDRASLTAFVLIGVAIFSWLLWLAGRDLLPPGAGPDLTHHLLLAGYIEQHWRLPHDSSLGGYLGEMLNYTPGTHLLAALAGAWTRTDGLHAVYPLVAFAVALKSGFVFLITCRLVNASVPRMPFALVSVLLLLLPRAYFVGSFTHSSFLAQVFAETFAVALWWALIVWDQQPGADERGNDRRSWLSVFFAIVGAATFLTWPVWIGPPLVAFAVCVASRTDIDAAERAKQFTLSAAAIGAVALLHATGRAQSAGIISAAGFVLRPAPALFGWAFLLVCGAGVCVGVFGRRTRTIPLFLGAIALQGGALFVVAQARGAAAPYLALKMVYLAIYPLAVAGAVGMAVVWRAMLPPTPSFNQSGWRGARILQWSRAALWLLVTVLGVAIARTTLRVPRPTPTISASLLRAGNWARANVDSRCVDYLVADSYSAYWLHLAVLGNPRHNARSLESDTYEPRPALGRWIEPGGLPYAIAEDFSALPKDIRESVDIAARFGPAVVIKRRGSSSCAP